MIGAADRTFEGVIGAADGRALGRILGWAWRAEVEEGNSDLSPSRCYATSPLAPHVELLVLTNSEDSDKHLDHRHKPQSPEPVFRHQNPHSQMEPNTCYYTKVWQCHPNEALKFQKETYLSLARDAQCKQRVYAELHDRHEYPLSSDVQEFANGLPCTAAAPNLYGNN